jgi:3-hydroxyisobutyrate dehydrogenase
VLCGHGKSRYPGAVECWGPSLRQEQREVIRGGAAASFKLDERDQRMVHGSDETKSALDSFVKDLGLVLDAARANSYPAPLASAAEQLYLAGRRAGLGRHDDSAVIEILRGGPSPAY